MQFSPSTPLASPTNPASISPDSAETIMTSFLDAIALDDTNVRLASRKAVIAAKTRVDQQFGEFLAQYGEQGLEYVADDIRGVVTAAAEEFGTDPDPVYWTVIHSYREKHGDEVVEVKPYPRYVNARTAAIIHEARKPKMCPFHRDVVDISLAEGSAKAGFDAMAQHWGGPRHCDGEGYEGDNCKFKPQMVTQSYWDEKTEKAEERKQQRAEQAELEAQQPVVEENVTEEPVAEIAPDTEMVAPEGGEVVEVDFGGSESAPEAEVPMSMAAKTADKDVTGLGGPEPTIDKRKWTPQTVKEIDTDGDSPNPTERQDVVERSKPTNATDPSHIGEDKTERVDVTQDHDQISGEGTKTWTEGDKSAVSSTHYDGFISDSEIQKAVLAHRNR